MVLILSFVSLLAGAQSWEQRAREVGEVEQQRRNALRIAGAQRDMAEFLSLARVSLPAARGLRGSGVTGACRVEPSDCDYSCGKTSLAIERMDGQPVRILDCELTLADNSVCQVQYGFESLESYRKALTADCWDAGPGPRYNRWTKVIKGVAWRAPRSK